jgi:hypothetical protein
MRGLKEENRKLVEEKRIMCLLIEKDDKGRILLSSEIRKAEKLKEGDKFALDSTKSEKSGLIEVWSISESH